MSSSYFLCATPRTGSTWLCSLLKSTNVAGIPESYFRKQDLEKWAGKWGYSYSADEFLHYAERMTQEAQTSNGVMASRIMWGTLGEIIHSIKNEANFAELRDGAILSEVFGPLKYVYLKRRDYIAQAVSRLRAEQSNIWHSTDINKPQNSEGLMYDFQALHEFVKEAEADNKDWEDWFTAQDIKPHIIIYENLQKQPKEEIERILQFLNIPIPSNFSLETPNKRLADELSQKWIDLYNRDCRGGGVKG